HVARVGAALTLGLGLAATCAVLGGTLYPRPQPLDDPAYQFTTESWRVRLDTASSFPGTHILLATVLAGGLGLSVRPLAAVAAVYSIAVAAAGLALGQLCLQTARFTVAQFSAWPPPVFSKDIRSQVGMPWPAADHPPS
ncbi:MAG: hypothetical protein C4345_12495, partial [Chloroflexota bacterium]